MKVWNGIESFPEGGPRSVATIGNYDGFNGLHQSDWAASAATEQDFNNLKHKLAPKWQLPDA